MNRRYDDETIEAIKGSVKKWEAVSAGAEIDHGHRDCPLCKLFFEESCVGCPIKDKTHQACCEGTPYQRWTELTPPTPGIPFPRVVKNKETLEAAVSMTKFLEDVLKWASEDVPEATLPLGEWYEDSIHADSPNRGIFAREGGDLLCVQPEPGFNGRKHWPAFSRAVLEIPKLIAYFQRRHKPRSQLMSWAETVAAETAFIQALGGTVENPKHD